MELARQEADLLIVDEHLPDGSWSDVLDYLIASGKVCEIVVSTQAGDTRLWAEVLSRGGYDVLVEPYDHQEVPRIIEGALHSRYLKRFAGFPASNTFSDKSSAHSRKLRRDMQVFRMNRQHDSAALPASINQRFPCNAP